MILNYIGSSFTSISFRVVSIHKLLHHVGVSHRSNVMIAAVVPVGELWFLKDIF